MHTNCFWPKTFGISQLLKFLFLGRGVLQFLSISQVPRIPLAFGTLALILAPVLAQSPAADDQPQYTPTGELLLPKDFKKWIFVGSNLGLSYKKTLTTITSREAARVNPATFHNVYIAPSAYSAFLDHKIFPDKTILVMQIFDAADKEPKGILSSGMFNGNRSGVEVAVKNYHRPDGKTTPWAYYVFTDPQDSTKTVDAAPAFNDDDCETCHRAHASIDNVWVQFYPSLRD